MKSLQLALLVMVNNAWKIVVVMTKACACACATASVAGGSGRVVEQGSGAPIPDAMVLSYVQTGQIIHGSG